VLECEVAAILLTEDGAYNWAFLLAEGVSSDVVRDCEEDERMELNANGCVGGFEEAALPAIFVDVVDGWRVVERRALLLVVVWFGVWWSASAQLKLRLERLHS
jgi:hypothetical protein